MGDLNIDVYQEEDFFEEALINLNAVLPERIGAMNYSSDGSFNDVGGGSPKWIDHVLYSNAHLQPTESTVEILVPLADELLPVCWCDECVVLRGYKYAYGDNPPCSAVREVQHLGDHQPVIGRFIF